MGGSSGFKVKADHLLGKITSKHINCYKLMPLSKFLNHDHDVGDKNKQSVHGNENVNELHPS